MPLESPYRNPGRWRAVINANDVRHGTAGCLLSIVLIAPCFVEQFGFGVVISFVLFYSLVVVPSVTNFFSLSKVTVKIVRSIARGFSSISEVVSLPTITEVGNVIVNIFLLLWSIIIHNPLKATCTFVSWIHNFYVTFLGLRITSNQIIFMMLCEKNCGIENRTASLYFLLFYSVLAYLYKSLLTRQWGQNFYDTNVRDFLKLTTWFITVRLGKGVAMAFVLIVFTAKFNDVDIPFGYAVVTSFYFLVTQKQWSGKERLILWIKFLQFDCLDEDEEFWVPFYIRSIPPLISAGLIAMVGLDQLVLCLIGVYANIVVPGILLQRDLELQVMSDSASSFSRTFIHDMDKNKATCPVCLDTMRICRLTPCHHAFHGACLRKWLAVSSLCPLCKQPLKYGSVR